MPTGLALEKSFQVVKEVSFSGSLVFKKSSGPINEVTGVLQDAIIWNKLFKVIDVVLQEGQILVEKSRGGSEAVGSTIV